MDHPAGSLIVRQQQGDAAAAADAVPTRVDLSQLRALVLETALPALAFARRLPSAPPFPTTHHEMLLILESVCQHTSCGQMVATSAVLPPR